MNNFFQEIERWPYDWDGRPAVLLLSCLRAEAPLRPYLGLGECKAILRALAQGVGVENREALEQLLLQLLAKKAGDQKAIQNAVEVFFQTRARELYREARSLLDEAEPEAPATTGKEEAERLKRLQEEAERIKRLKEEAERNKKKEQATTPVPQQTTETQVQLELALSSAEIAALPDADSEESTDSGYQSAINHPYILTDDFQPITVRQMEQMWRFLRKPSVSNRFHPAPDVPATVEKIARHGWLDAPVWQRDKTNKVHLVLLIDHTGSMTAWHLLARQLTATARAGGGHRRAEIRWFHNLPQQFDPAKGTGILFKDSSHLQTEALNDLLRRCSKQDTEVLIFSDAGAARGRLNTERAKATERLLYLLRRHVSSVAWLNPMPANRWWGSSAEQIAHHVHMFETAPRGFMSMINHLRGQK